MLPADHALEVCVGDIASARAAVRGGADRVELCSSLSEGGLTPSIGLVEEVVRIYASHARAPAVHVLIRCRGGDFCFSDAEIAVMCADIRAVKRAGADGVVIGCLRANLTIDRDACGRLLRLAKSLHMKTTLHRAIDMCPDPVRALEGVLGSELRADLDFVLTSGGGATALDGVHAILKMKQLTARRAEQWNEAPVTIIAAAGVSEKNMLLIITETQVEQLHGSFRVPLPGSSQGAFSFASPAGRAERLVSSEARIRAAGKVLRRFWGRDGTTFEMADLNLAGGEEHPEQPEFVAENLRTAMRTSFVRGGFVVLRNFLSKTDVAAAVAELDSLVDAIHSTKRGGEGEIPCKHVMYDDVARPLTLKQIQMLHTHSAYFGELITKRFSAVAALLLGEDAVAKNMQYFNKPPTSCYAAGDSSRETPPHQDAYYFMIEPPSHACTMWLALDTADECNGCLRYTLGSASRGMRQHDFSEIKGFSQSIIDFDETDELHEVVIDAAPGDLVVHQSMMIHRAGRNVTADRSRRAVGAIFYGASATRDDAAYDAKQRLIAQRAAALEGQAEAAAGPGTTTSSRVVL